MAYRRLKTAPDGALTYCYDADLHNPDIRCEFTMLSEVGEPYKPWFVAELRRRQIVVATRELPYKPWVQDFDAGRTAAHIKNYPLIGTRK